MRFSLRIGKYPKALGSLPFGAPLPLLLMVALANGDVAATINVDAASFVIVDVGKRVKGFCIPLV
jgi:hypothetical protein